MVEKRIDEDVHRSYLNFNELILINIINNLIGIRSDEQKDRITDSQSQILKLTEK